MNLGRAYSIVGWMSGPELQYLAETAAKSLVIVEAGSFHGKSTRALGDNTKGIVHAVDPWKPMIFPNGLGAATGVEVDGTTFTRFCMNVGDLIKVGRIHPHKMAFTDYKMPEDTDFCFIDALHDYVNCKSDILHALKYQKQGILAGHDYSKDWPGVTRAVNETFGANVKVIDTIWSVQL